MIRLASFDLAAGGYAEALLGAGMSFSFWHCSMS
jgi:hypothetical protein